MNPLLLWIAGLQLLMLINSNSNLSPEFKTYATQVANNAIEYAQNYKEATATEVVKTETPQVNQAVPQVVAIQPILGGQIIPEKKVMEIQYQIDRKVGQFRGVVMLIRAYYLENGVKQEGSNMSLISSDNGEIAANGKPFANESKTVKNVGDDGTPGVNFTYIPTSEDDITLTFKVGDYETNTIVKGQLPKDKWPKE